MVCFAVMKNTRTFCRLRITIHIWDVRTLLVNDNEQHVVYSTTRFLGQNRFLMEYDTVLLIPLLLAWSNFCVSSPSKSPIYKALFSSQKFSRFPVASNLWLHA